MQKDYIKAKFAGRDAIMLFERRGIMDARLSIDDYDN
jgi:hypothetical protein